jgi:asparagine synthase (glutamine-hydrolysing)
MSGVRALVVGRFAFTEDQWSQSEKLSFEGGLAARMLLDRWLRGGVTQVETLNGGGLAIIIDERQRHLHVWTDRMGVYPAFGSAGSFKILGSHPDVIAHVLESVGATPKFDPATMAEFLATGTATHPHTYWGGIDHLDAGTHYKIDWSRTVVRCERRIYWRPAYFSGTYLTNRNDIVERLQAALTGAVQRRTLERLGKVAVLLSSGADSRAALFAARDPSKVTCYTFYDEPNPELKGARALAKVAGAEHIAIRRDRDYYFRHAKEAVRASGGMWSIESAHHGGLCEAFGTAVPDVVLSGCYADYLLKGIAYNHSPKRIFGRPIPLNTFSSYERRWHHPHFSLSDDWEKRVEDRLNCRYNMTSSQVSDAQSAAEYLRLSPLVREPDASGRLFLRRFTGLDVFIADNEVIELFGSIAPDQKINGIPFGMAVERICGEGARKVLNNNYSAPVGATEFARIRSFLLSSLKRKVRRAVGGRRFADNTTSIATLGSWPDFARAAPQSQVLNAWYAAREGAEDDFLSSMLGEARRRRTLEEWAKAEPTLLLRYYTAALWLSAHPGALG